MATSPEAVAQTLEAVVAQSISGGHSPGSPAQMPNGAGPLDTALAEHMVAHIENPAAATATLMPVVPTMEELETRLMEMMMSQFSTMGFFQTAAPQSAAPQTAATQMTRSLP